MLFKKQKRSMNIYEILPQTIIDKLMVYGNLNEDNNVVVFCSQLISNLVSSLPLALYKVDKNNNYQRADDHYLYQIISKIPNIYETPSIFYSTIINDMIKTGNAFIYIARDQKTNKVTQLIRINPEQVNINQEGFYREYIVAGERYTTNNIIHIPSSLGYNGIVGKGVIECAKERIMLSEEISSFLKIIFNNSYFSRLKINLNDSSYNDADVNKIKELLDFFAGLFTNVNNGKPLVEFSGIKLEPIEHQNVTEELTKNRELIDRQICNYFNVPYYLLTSENKYNSIEQMFQFLITTCLTNYTDKIAQYFTKALLTGSEQQKYIFSYDYTELLYTNIEVLNKVIIERLKNGVISINEARQSLNYNRLPGNAVNTNFITGVGIVTDDVFESWGAGSKLKQKELEDKVNE